MRNKLTDLNNELFAEIERLSDEDLKGDDLTDEIKRASAISKISTQIINNGNLAIRAAELKGEYGRDVTTPLLGEIVDGKIQRD